MAYVQVKMLQTWKIAAFLVAFFSSFVLFAQDAPVIELDRTDPKPPKLSEYFDCVAADLSIIGTATNILGCDISKAFDIWKTLQNKHETYYGEYSNLRTDTSQTIAIVDYTICQSLSWNGSCSNGSSYVSGGSAQIVSKGDFSSSATCPPDGFLEHMYGNDTDNDGKIDVCYKLLKESEDDPDDKKNEDYCDNLVLDSGNNTADTMCYTSYAGHQCNVTRVNVGDYSYYKGSGSVTLGCGSSDKPPYDNTGTGNGDDKCIYSNGINYCQADRNKHCKTTAGVEICDDGCIDDGNTVMCDTNRHNDVGEGESDKHDGNGTCSVIFASSSKGYCEDMGGNWDDKEDYQETVCPSGTGTCSVPTAGQCQACFDAGGNWTPDVPDPTDPTKTPSEETKATVEVSALVKKSNEKLTQIEAGQRSTTTTLVSTIKSGNGKTVTAIENLTKIIKDTKTTISTPSEEPEKETFTTNTTPPDKSAFNSLFDAASTAALKAENELKETEIKNLMKTIAAEGVALFSISGSATGYQARQLTLTQGSFDVSLSRFSSFFALLAAPIMMICSIYAAFIILGKN